MRRRFFIASGVLTLAARWQMVFAGEKAAANGAEWNALGPFLDTLIPGGDAPSASETGVKTAILSNAASDPRRRRLLLRGCRWLDVQALRRGASKFSALTPSLREEVVSIAAASKRRTVPRVFFDQVRKDAFEHYYLQPAVWRWLNYPGPPQPKGFIDAPFPPAAKHG